MPLRTRFKVAVCENSAELLAGSGDWTALCKTVRMQSPDLLLLNEMPFGSWIAGQPEFHHRIWEESLRRHDQGLQRLDELGAAAIAFTRPNTINERRVNEGCVWTQPDGARGLHTKQYFPDEEGYFEARWFQAGDRNFCIARAGEIRCGFLICTEVMFNEHARHYGRNGTHVILAPRAVGGDSLSRWLVAMRMAAIVSGCYVLSSNRSGTDARGQAFGGCGWIIDPAGELVAQTSPDDPVVSHEIDLELVRRAQREYPCYVSE